MKNYFYLFLFASSSIMAEKESLVNIALTHLNPTNKVVVKIAAKKQEQLKTLKQNRTKHEQNLRATNKSIEEANKKPTATEDEAEHELLQKILHKIASVEKELISFFDTFIQEIELSLENFSSLQLPTPHSAFPINNMQQLTEIIAHNEKLIDQLTIQRNTIKIEQGKKNQELQKIILSFAHNNENSKSTGTKQLHDLEKKLIELQREKYEVISSFIKLLQKDLALLKEQIQYNTSSPSTHKPTKPIVHPLSWLLDYAKNSSSLSRITAILVGLVGSRRIYKYATKQKKPQLVEIDQEEEQQDEMLDEPNIPKENFSDYYGYIPPEIDAIYKKLEADDSKNKLIRGPIPILLGPGKKSLARCLAGQLNAYFYPIDFNTLIENFLKKKQVIDVKNLSEEELVKDLVEEIEKAKQYSKKRTIIYLEKIDVNNRFSSKIQNEIMKAMENESNTAIIGSLRFLSSRQLFANKLKKIKAIEIPLPDEKARRTVIEKNKVAKGLRLTDKMIEILVARSKRMKISQLLDIMDSIAQFNKQEGLITDQGIKKIIARKKAEINRKFQKQLPKKIRKNCLFPQEEESYGEIPSPLLEYIKQVGVNFSNTPQIKRFLFSGPSGSGGEFLAQYAAGFLGAPFFKIPLENLFKEANNDLAYISLIQEKAQDIQSNTIVIYLDGHMDSIIEQFRPIEQEIILRDIATNIKKIENFNDDVKILIFGRLTKNEKKLKKAEKNGSVSILKELVGLNGFDCILDMSAPDEHHIKKILEEYGEKFGGFSEEVDIASLARKLNKRYPSDIINLLHQAKNITHERGENKISPTTIEMVGEYLIGEKWSIIDRSPDQLKDADLRLENFGGDIPPQIKNLLIRLLCPKHFERFGVAVQPQTFIWGPPGTGKSLLPREIAKKFKSFYKSISASEFAKRFVGEGAEEMEKVFNEIEEIAKRDKNGPPPVLIIEEAEVFLRKSDENSKARAGMDATRAKFLTRMTELNENEEKRAEAKFHKWELRNNNQMTSPIRKFLEKLLENHSIPPSNKVLYKKQLEENKINPRVKALLEEQLEEELKELGTSILVFTTTNASPKDCDKASLRSGRFDSFIETGYPDKKTKKSILNLNLAKRPIGDSKIDLDKFVEELEETTTGKKISGADLATAVKHAAFKAAVKNSYIDNHYLNLGLKQVLEQRKKIKKGKSHF